MAVVNLLMEDAIEQGKARTLTDEELNVLSGAGNGFQVCLTFELTYSYDENGMPVSQSVDTNQLDG